MSDKVYVLSASYHSKNGDGNMYLSGQFENQYKQSLDTTVTRLCEALVFKTEEDAWSYRINIAAGGWQVTPVDAKRIFEEKLKG